jgi:hypothetical protein
VRTFIFGGSGDVAYTATHNIGGALNGADTGRFITQYIRLESSATKTNVITGGNIVLSHLTPTIYQNGSGVF